MSTPGPLSDLIERLALVAESMMNSARPSDEQVTCPMCSLRAIEAGDHDIDCAYRIARTRMTPDDIKRVRRLARVIQGEM